MSDPLRPILAMLVLLAGCSSQPPTPAASSYQAPPPGTVTVHMNGAVGVAVGKY